MTSDALTAQQPFLDEDSFVSLKGKGVFKDVEELDVNIVHNFYKVIVVRKLLEIGMTFQTSGELTERPNLTALAVALASICMELKVRGWDLHWLARLELGE